jgi:hypothetical protein
MLGSLLTQWTIRLALVCLAVYWGGSLWLATRSISRRSIDRSPSNRKTRAEEPKFALLRWIWTAGCVLFVTHVACAFHFTHHWSHVHAWNHTAAETQRLLGFSFGDGIYFSYLFLVLWVVDVALQWLNVQRPMWLVASVYLFLFFIAVNGAIVFEDGPTRPVGTAVVAVLAVVFALFVWKRYSVRTGSNASIANSRTEAEA